MDKPDDFCGWIETPEDKPMSKGVWKIIVVNVVVFLSVILVGDYAYYRGFDDGADAAMCAISHQVDGREFAMKQRYCLAIKGRTPPPRLFGGDQ